ncbi:hypothetical protein VPH35_000369 [Triticum aestivum]|uniref:Uncharacterized protein n=1 Tax=Triticum turgidum subsp. durum TaxID=4567 RepID=A0A9R0UTM9_TRITD|nr:unnamed protein product [Triticum turgidum subsp. durum]
MCMVSFFIYLITICHVRKLYSCPGSVRASRRCAIPVHTQEEAVQVTSSSRLRKYSNTGGTPHSRVAATWSSAEPTGCSRHTNSHMRSWRIPPAASATRESLTASASDGFGTMHVQTITTGRAGSGGGAVVRQQLLARATVHELGDDPVAAAPPEPRHLLRILLQLHHLNLVIFHGCTSSRSSVLLLVYE